MSNTTITGHISLTASTVSPFGIGSELGAFSVQFINPGNGQVTVGIQDTMTDVASCVNGSPVLPYSTSATYWSAGASAENGTSDISLAVFPSPDSDQASYKVAYVITVLG